MWGSGAARSHSVVSASQGRSGPAQRIIVGRGRVCGPPPSSGKAAYCAAGAPGERVVVHHGLLSCPHSAPTMCASHAVMELRPMIHVWKSAPRRCFEKPAGRSKYGWRFSLVGPSRVPFTRWRQVTKSPLGRAGGGGQ